MQYIGLFKMMLLMIGLRVFFILAITMFCSLVSFYIIIVMIYARMGTEEELQHQNERERRLPEVKRFIQLRAENFDPVGNPLHEKVKDDTCAICLEEFKSDLSVVRLDCNPIHVFHKECIEAWIEKNDNCPNCREPILAKDYTPDVNSNTHPYRLAV